MNVGGGGDWISLFPSGDDSYNLHVLMLPTFGKESPLAWLQQEGI